MMKLGKERINTNILVMIAKTREKGANLFRITQTEKHLEIDVLLKQKKDLGNAMIQAVFVKIALEGMVDHWKKQEPKNNRKSIQINKNLKIENIFLEHLDK